MSPSSVPAQIRLTSVGESPSVYTTPRCVGLACGVSRYFPTDAGTSQVLRVRSGLICVHVLPPSIVFQIVLHAKNSVFLSAGENTTGSVRSILKSGDRNVFGEIDCTCVVRRSYFVTLPP